MLTFFRHIRKGLINSSSTRKYILYAAGEILLVMIGILLAFQVNNWNEHRLRRLDEINILSSLISGLELDVADIKSNIRIHENVQNSCQIILDHLSNDLPYHDSLAAHFNNSILYSIFIHTTSAFQTLKSQGVDLISNEKLRDKVIDVYDGRYRYIHYAETSNVNRMEDALNDFLSTRFEDSYNIDIDPQSQDFSGRMVPLNYTVLKSDQPYIYFLRSTMNRNVFYLNVALNTAQRSVEDTIEEIKSELNYLHSDD